jgi:hypothetical protein
VKRIPPRRLLAIAVVAAFLAAVVAGYAISGQTGLLVTVAAGQVLLLGAGLAGWRELRAAQRRIRTDLRAVTATVDEGLGQVRGAAQDTERRLRETIRKGVTGLARETAQYQADYLQVQLRKEFQQVESLAALYYELRPARSIPATRSWSASPDLLRTLYEKVRYGDQRLVLECGSGVSTLVFGYALRARGQGRVVALEHDEHYAELSRELLRAHGLSDWAEIRSAPLKPVDLDDDSWPWYDLAEVPPRANHQQQVDWPPRATPQTY